MEEPKRKRPLVPQEQVLSWLQQQFPQLAANAEVDRAWCWISQNLSGEHNRKVRDSLKEFGFRFAKRGHKLPSGTVGTWGHSCTSPLPFYRKGKGTASVKPTSPTATQPRHELDDEIRALLELV